MSSFQPRAYSKQGEFRDLLNLIDELKAELESRKEACKRLKAENLRVEKEKKDAEKHLFALETGRASTSTMGASAKQRAIQRAAKEQHRELQAMSMKAAKASEEAEGLRQALDEASERLKSLEEDVGALREERDAAREEGEELRDQLARVGWEKEQELNKLQAEKDREIEEKGNEAEQRLEAAYAEHGKELSQLSDHYETLEADKIALEELLRNREQELERATASVHSSKVSPEEVKWQVVSVSREGSVKEVSATEEFEFFSFETTLEIVLKGLSGEFFSETLFAIGSLSKPGIHSNFRIPKGTQPFLVLNTKLLVEVSQSSETGELIPLQDSELELRFFSAAETFLGVWTEGPRGDCKVAAFAAYLGEENTAIALFEVDDSNGGLAYSHGLLNCAPQKAQQPDLARGEFLVEISRMDGQRLEAARSSGMFNVGKRKVTRNDENGRERTFEVWQVIEGRAERTAELQGCGFRDVDAGAGAAHSPLSGAGAVAEAAIPLTPAPQPGGGRGPHGLKPFPLRRPSDGGQGSGVGELTACLRFVSAVPPLREPLEGRRSAGSDAEGVAEAPNHHPPMDAAAVPPESAAAAPPAKAAATLVEAAAAVRGCLRELLGMSPSPADDDEAVDRAEAAVDRARAELREAEASVRLCVEGFASTARELGAACDSSADITAIAVSSQAAAAREAAEAAMAALEQQSWCCLDSALCAGGSHNTEKAQDCPFPQLGDLCQELTDARRRLADVCAAAGSADREELRGAWLWGLDKDGGLFLRDIAAAFLSQIRDEVDSCEAESAAALGKATRRAEDPSEFAAASRELSAELRGGALRVASVIHMCRAGLMRAALLEGHRSGSEQLVRSLHEAAAGFEEATAVYGSSARNEPPTCPTASWQLLSHRARRSATAARAAWRGYLTDAAADSLLLCGARADAVRVALSSAKASTSSVFAEAADELRSLVADGSPLAGADDAEFEAKNVISTARIEASAAVASAERRAMQALMTPLAVVEEAASASLRPTPAAIVAERRLERRAVAINPRRGRDLAGDGSIRREALDPERLSLGRNGLTRNIFLALDPKPYQGSTATPRELEREERNKKILQWVRRVAAKLNWEVRNAKDIERLADSGVDEEGLVVLFDVVLRLAPGIDAAEDESETAQIVDLLQLSGVPICDVQPELTEADCEEDFADKILKSAIQQRMAAPVPQDVTVSHQLSLEEKTALVSEIQDFSKEIIPSLEDFLEAANSAPGAERSARFLESDFRESVFGLERSLLQILKACGDTTQPLEELLSYGFANNGSFGASTNNLATTVKSPWQSSDLKPLPDGEGRYALTDGSTESENEEQGVSQSARRISFAEDEDDTLTQSFTESQG